MTTELQLNKAEQSTNFGKKKQNYKKLVLTLMSNLLFVYEIQIIHSDNHIKIMSCRDNLSKINTFTLIP